MWLRIFKIISLRFQMTSANIHQMFMHPTLCLGLYIHLWSWHYFNPIRSKAAPQNASAGPKQRDSGRPDRSLEVVSVDQELC